MHDSQISFLVVDLANLAQRFVPALFASKHGHGTMDGWLLSFFFPCFYFFFGGAPLKPRRTIDSAARPNFQLPKSLCCCCKTEIENGGLATRKDVLKQSNYLHMLSCDQTMFGMGRVCVTITRERSTGLNCSIKRCGLSANSKETRDTMKWMTRPPARGR